MSFNRQSGRGSALDADGPSAHPPQFLDPEEARSFLRTMMSDPASMFTIRRALLEEGVSLDLSALSDHQVVDLLAGRLASARFRIAAVPRGRAGVGQARPTEEEPAQEAPREAPAFAPDVTHWLTIELVDEDGKPVPNTRYEVTFPNGKKKDGRLNPQGLARFRNLTSSGECQVTFPDLDMDAWKRA